MAANNPIIVEKSGLSLTGTWSMTDLAKMPVNATVGVLSRYMAGRVNPYTGVVAEELCRSFELPVKGRKNIEAAVALLKTVGSLGDVLEFGVGIEDVVRSMARSEGGSMCLALCSALKDTYSDDVAVEVLLEFARLSKVDGQWMPSGLEWKNLLDACAGALAASTFSQRAEFLMCLVKNDPCLGAADQGLTARPKGIRRCSTPKSIAEALLILAQISRGKLQAITFIGGSDTGWLAAIAEWFLDLRVAILNEDGEIHYTNWSDSDDVQVMIVHSESAEGAGQSLQCVGKTYRLEDVSELFEAEMRPLSDACVSGRLEWKSALSSAFLADFRTMMKDPQTIGELIGSASRLFKALAQGDPMFSTLELKACISYCDQSYGGGFINNILQWFPELGGLKEAMSQAVSRNVEGSRRVYDHCIALTKQRCGCSLCRYNWTETKAGSNETDDKTNDDDDCEMTPAPHSASSDQDSSSWRDVSDSDDDRYCLVALAETIIVLGRALANLSLRTKDICPKRSGLELVYGRQFNLRHLEELNKRDMSRQGQIIFVLDIDRDSSVKNMAESGEEAGEVRLQTILGLFTGRDAPVISARTSAVCVNGICAFLGILSDPSEDRDSVGRIHVLPGRIQYQKKSYDKVEDRVLLRDEAGDFSQAMKVVRSGKSFNHRTLSVKESSTALQCLLELSVGEEIGHQALRVGPGALATLLASRRGLVSCGMARNSRTRDSRKLRRACKTLTIGRPEEIDEARKGNASLKIGETSIEVLRCEGSNIAIAAIASSTYLDSNCSVYLADKECLDCCISTVMAVNRPEKSSFGIFFLPH
jgi:hypothetical protein